MALSLRWYVFHLVVHVIPMCICTHVRHKTQLRGPVKSHHSVFPLGTIFIHYTNPHISTGESTGLKRSVAFAFNHILFQLIYFFRPLSTENLEVIFILKQKSCLSFIPFKPPRLKTRGNVFEHSCYESSSCPPEKYCLIWRFFDGSVTPLIFIFTMCNVLGAFVKSNRCQLPSV